MASGDKISCKAFFASVLTQEPVYDKEILKDVRPTEGGLMGYYQTGMFDAYSGVEHTFDRFNDVYPDVTKPWSDVSGTQCVGSPCDPDENKIAWGTTRKTYGRQKTSWATDVLCFDEIMTRTRAKEHFAQIIADVLKPATQRIMSFYLARRAAELAGKKLAITAAGLVDFTFTWDSGGYQYMTATQDPTGRLTPEILRSRVYRQYALGAIDMAKEGFDRLELHTDIDTFHYLSKQDPVLLDAWRFGEFGPAAKEFFKYGFSGYVGDFMVKCLMFPIRFNKVSAGRYQVVLPYKNVATTLGIRSEYNEDYEKAQWQFSYINNKRALRVMPFKPEAVNKEMPFLVRDYAGRWKFGTNDLGADCNGKPVDNVRGNKGKFYADFDLAVKPEHDEWLELLFHKRDRPCITIVSTCNTDPGYPQQYYDSYPASCPSVLVFTAVAKGGVYTIAANSITADGNVVTHIAVSQATLAGLIASLPTLGGTWSIYDSTTLKIQLSGSTFSSITLPFAI